ncbi:hypothetical protein CFRS1_v013655 [Colletotrichum fructicola]|nr:hypothetical protein CFRS1_v013655 [Colletotrichum fructicola]
MGLRFCAGLIAAWKQLHPASDQKREIASTHSQSSRIPLIVEMFANLLNKTQPYLPQSAKFHRNAYRKLKDSRESVDSSRGFIFSIMDNSNHN